MITIYRKSSTGKTLFHEFKTEGNKFIRRWGQLDGKIQTTTKECIGMNIGKSNETSPSEQAILEMNAKTELKMKEGYSLTKPTEEELKTDLDPTVLDLDNLPKAFCPSKPISKMPDKVLKDPKSYANRKYNGHCLILVRGTGPTKVYTRRMEDITEYVKELPTIKFAMSNIPRGSFILHECIYYSNQYQKEMPRFVAQVIRKEDAEECLARYTKLSETGVFSMIPFDALFLAEKFIGDIQHLDRVKLLELAGIKTPVFIPNWTSETIRTECKKKNWEGFVIRQPGESSFIGYSMSGKPDRMGCYKDKFLPDPEDFVVDEVQKGKSGKHADFYSKFHVFQYDSEGNKVDRGYVGAGTLDHDTLKELTESIDNKKQKLPFVVEIEFQSVHDESGKLEFGQIQRLRPDKSPNECLSE